METCNTKDMAASRLRETSKTDMSRPTKTLPRRGGTNKSVDRHVTTDSINRLFFI